MLEEETKFQDPVCYVATGRLSILKFSKFHRPHYNHTLTSISDEIRNMLEDMFSANNHTIVKMASVYLALIKQFRPVYIQHKFLTRSEQSHQQYTHICVGSFLQYSVPDLWVRTQHLLPPKSTKLSGLLNTAFWN